MEQNYVTVTVCIVRTPYPFVRNLSASATGDATISASDVLVLDVVVRLISISRRSECADAADAGRRESHEFRYCATDKLLRREIPHSTAASRARSAPL